MCGVSIRRAPAFEAKEVKAGLLRVLATADTPIQWRIKCTGKPDNVTITRRGMSHIVVREGCTVYWPEGAYTLPPTSIKVETKLEFVDQHDLSVLPPSLAVFDDWSDVERVLSEHDVEEYLTATKLAELRETHTVAHLKSVTWGGNNHKSY